MIVYEKCLVKSSKFYQKLGYDITDKYIFVNIEDIPIGSHCLIDVVCDYCSRVKKIKYRDYNKNISINGKFSCSIKCGVLKSKETSLNKWGVDSPNKLDSKKQKTKLTLIDRYGVDHVSRIDDVASKKSSSMKAFSDVISNRMSDFWKNLTEEELTRINKKRESTNLENYGVINVSQLDSIKDKIKNTNIDKWGGFTYQSSELLDKVKKTNLDKYGVTFSASSDEVRKKMEDTNIERWGCKNPLSNNEIRDKIKNTLFLKYGVDNPMLIQENVEKLKSKFKDKYGTDSYFKTDEFKKSLSFNPLGKDVFRKNLLINNYPGYIEYIGDEESKFLCDKNHYFTINSINFHNRIRLNKELCTICNPISETNTSISEKEVYKFIKEIYEGEVIQSYRDGLEIDIFLPELKIGFEFNGLYWHSEEFKSKTYHLDKLNYFKSKEVRIYYLWEDDWNFKREILKSQIKNWIDLTENKIFARKCKIMEIKNPKIYRKFLDENHIQGFVRSTIKIGLFFEEELVSIMTFDKSEGRKKMKEGEWNLSRFCNRINTNVIGSASKLLNYFINNYFPKRIISYADSDWSDGKLYHKLGFELDSIIGPDYKYIIDGRRVNKQNFSKSKLGKTDSKLTEKQIMKSLKINKVWNTGHIKFQLLL